MFSNDETVSDQLVKCFDIIATLACRLNHNAGRDASIVALCKLALPVGYFAKVLSNVSGTNISNGSPGSSEKCPAACE